MSMREVGKHCFTGKDGESFDLGRILWALGAVTTIGLSVASVAKGHPFDVTAFGIGFAAVLGGGGLGLHLKSGTEPEAP